MTEIASALVTGGPAMEALTLVLLAIGGGLIGREVVAE